MSATRLSLEGSLAKLWQTQMATLDAKYVRDSLSRAAKSRTGMFGADGHGFSLNPPLEVREVGAFEARHGICFPEDYFQFITEVANGGAGPDYGLFPLGYMDDLGGKLKRWEGEDGFVGILSEPFQFTESWNDTTGMPDYEQEDEEGYDEKMNIFEERYWASSLMNGAIPICHPGCALRLWLVVTGKEAGHIWHDGRADFSGICPLSAKDGSRTTFSSWYSEWLEEVVSKCR
jgi:hypothetical protein